MLKTRAGDIIGTHLMKRPEVEAVTCLSKSYIYMLMAKGLFPRPANLEPKSVAWVSDEVAAWIANRIAERDGGKAA